MSGHGTLYVSPCSAHVAAAASTLTLGAGFPDGTLVASGVAQPNNLIALSPPTLLEAYDLYALSIAWGVQLTAAPPAGSPVTVELRLLVNDRIAFATTDNGVTLDKVAAGHFGADLVNPLELGARARLALQVTLSIFVLGPVTGSFMLAAQPLDGANDTAASNWKAIESSISYRVLDLPASRRL